MLTQMTVIKIGGIAIYLLVTIGMGILLSGNTLSKKDLLKGVSLGLAILLIASYLLPN